MSSMGKASRNKKRNTNQSQSAREKLRAEIAAKQQKELRNKRLMVGGVIGAITLIVVIVAVAIGMGAKKIETEQIALPNIAENGNGVAVFTNAETKPDAPLVEVYQDFQCPGCAQVERVYGPLFEKLAQDGDIQLQFNTMTFLDRNYGGANKDSSTRAAMAAACSDTVGKYPEYHKTVLMNQSQNGSGYTEDQLRVNFPEQVGITGDDLVAFQSCYDGKATQKFVQDNAEAASRAGVVQTPTYMINGKQLDTQLMASVRDSNSLLGLLKATAGE